MKSSKKNYKFKRKLFWYDYDTDKIYFFVKVKYTYYIKDKKEFVKKEMIKK